MEERSASRALNNAILASVKEHSLGIQFGGVRSTSQVAKSFMGTGLLLLIPLIMLLKGDPLDMEAETTEGRPPPGPDILHNFDTSDNFTNQLN